MTRFVLVHGSFHGAWCWQRLRSRLGESGHLVEAFDLPGSGADQTPLARVTLDTYTDRICRSLTEVPEPAVLVAHSMGGVPVTQAAARCADRVALTVYVTAFAPSHGQSLQDLAGLPENADSEVPPNLAVSGDPPVATIRPAAARAAFYGRCTDTDAAWALGRLRPQPLAPFTSPVSLPPDVVRAPCCYILCTQDWAIRPALQRRMARDAGCAELVELDADHAPFLSATNKLTEALVRLTGG
jgi:pimeloyl-ACP methyl ester carboxylesterase